MLPLTPRLVIVALSILVAGCGDGASGPSTATPVGDAATPDVPGGSSDQIVIAAVDLTPGSCFDGPTIAAEEQARVETVEIVDCAEPHDLEVFHAFEFSKDEPYPGEDAVIELSESGCAEAFVTSIGDAAALEQLAIWPTRESWDGGDRAVVCAAFAEDGGQLVGKLR